MWYVSRYTPQNNVNLHCTPLSGKTYVFIKKTSDPLWTVWTVWTVRTPKTTTPPKQPYPFIYYYNNIYNINIYNKRLDNLYFI